MKQSDSKNIMKMWKIPDSHKKYLEETSQMYKEKHGMFSSIPLICRGRKCPFFQTCTVDPFARIENSRCLMEVSAILSRFENYCSHFGISLEGDYIESKDLVDVSMIRDVIDAEIQIIRADNKIAISGDFMAEHISQIDKKCKAYYEEIIHPAAEYKNRLIESRHKMLNKLNATRKDKSDLLKNANNYSNKAQTIVEVVKQKAGGSINLENIDEINNYLSEFNNMESMENLENENKEIEKGE